MDLSDLIAIEEIKQLNADLEAAASENEVGEMTAAVVKIGLFLLLSLVLFVQTEKGHACRRVPGGSSDEIGRIYLAQTGLEGLYVG